MLVKKRIAKGGSPFAGARGVLAPLILPAAAGGKRKDCKALMALKLSLQFFQQYDTLEWYSEKNDIKEDSQ